MSCPEVFFNCQMDQFFDQYAPTSYQLESFKNRCQTFGAINGCPPGVMANQTPAQLFENLKDILKRTYTNNACDQCDKVNDFYKNTPTGSGLANSQAPLPSNFTVPANSFSDCEKALLFAAENADFFNGMLEFENPGNGGSDFTFDTGRNPATSYDVANFIPYATAKCNPGGLAKHWGEGTGTPVDLSNAATPNGGTYANELKAALEGALGACDFNTWIDASVSSPPYSNRSWLDPSVQDNHYNKWIRKKSVDIANAIHAEGEALYTGPTCVTSKEGEWVGIGSYNIGLTPAESAQTTPRNTNPLRNNMVTLFYPGENEPVLGTRAKRNLVGMYLFNTDCTDDVRNALLLAAFSEHELSFSLEAKVTLNNIGNDCKKRVVKILSQPEVAIQGGQVTDDMQVTAPYVTTVTPAQVEIKVTNIIAKDSFSDPQDAQFVERAFGRVTTERSYNFYGIPHNIDDSGQPGYFSGCSQDPQVNCGGSAAFDMIVNIPDFTFSTDVGILGLETQLKHLEGKYTVGPDPCTCESSPADYPDYSQVAINQCGVLPSPYVDGSPGAEGACEKCEPSTDYEYLERLAADANGECEDEQCPV